MYRALTHLWSRAKGASHSYHLCDRLKWDNNEQYHHPCMSRRQCRNDSGVRQYARYHLVLRQPSVWWPQRTQHSRIRYGNMLKSDLMIEWPEAAYFRHNAYYPYMKFEHSGWSCPRRAVRVHMGSEKKLSFEHYNTYTNTNCELNHTNCVHALSILTKWNISIEMLHRWMWLWMKCVILESTLH